MPTLPEHFDLLRTRLRPPQERADAARDLPAKVRAFLQDSPKIQTVAPHSRLAGSYARNTAIKQIKDVDILLMVSPDYYEQAPEIVHKDLFSALGGLPEALGDTGEVYPRRRNRRSISVRLDTHNFDLDIVPVVALNGLDKPLKIPDRNVRTWDDTHPLGYADVLSDLNGEHQGKVVRIIKLFKHWRDITMTNLRPKSYWLECMVYDRFAGADISGTNRSYAELFRDLLTTIYDTFEADFDDNDAVPMIYDPVLATNVTNWERSAFEHFMRCVDTTIRRANRALETDDEVVAVELWGTIFGADWFPDSATVKRALQLQAAAQSSNVYVTPSGRIETSRPEGRFVNPPAQRFYGDDDGESA